MNELQDNVCSPEKELDTDLESEHEATSQPTMESLIDSFVQNHGRPALSASSMPTSTPRLPYPVVIAQRRPGNRRRGFVEAYPPALEQYGISQDAFLAFINAMNEAIKQNKWLVAVQLAATGTSFVPNSIALGVSIAVQFIAGAIALVEARWKTNSFLDKVNNEYFRPRGLFCLLMSYKPIPMGKKDVPNHAEILSGALPSSSSSSSTFDSPLTARAKRNLRNPVAATAEGEDSLPSNIAPLVYLGASTQEVRSPSRESEKTQKLGDRIHKYLDKRAQARYAKESNGDVLANPTPMQFTNRYLDPNSAANSGGLLSLISGGYFKYDVEQAREQTRSAIATQERNLREQQSAALKIFQQQSQSMGFSPEQQKDYFQQCQDMYGLQLQQIQQQSELVEQIQPQRRIFRDLLYLMIVDMPSDTEMASVREQLNTSGQVQTTDGFAFTTADI